MPRRNRPTVVHPAALREVQVLRTEDVTPGLRRVTFTGEQLGAFEVADGVTIPELVSSGFDDDIRLVFAYPGDEQPVLPSYVDGKWVPPKGQRPLGRYYTIRRWDPATRELDVDFVRHGVGIAATWAYRAEPGDTLHFGGPSASQGLPDGFDWLLVVGDDTAAPAIARLLDELPEDARAQVFVEVADPSHRQRLRELPGVSVTWLTRDGSSTDGPQTGGLLDAVHAAPWWDGEVFAWVAGEQAVVRDVRRHLVEDRGVPKASIDFVGYWKRTDAVALADDPALADPEQADTSFEKFHEKSELLPPLAIRVAVELGIGELVAAGVRTPAALAARTGSVEAALRKFLRYLETIGLLTSGGEGEEYALTPSGEELADAWMISMLDPRGLTARREQGFFGLAESLRTGRAAYASVTGHAYRTLRDDPAFMTAHLDDQADGADYLVAPIAASRALAEVEHLVLHADVAASLAALVVEQQPAARVTIVARGPEATWLHADLPSTITAPEARARVTVATEPVSPVEPGTTVLLVNRLAEHTDAEAVTLLRRLATGLGPDGRLLVFEEAMDVTEIDDHDAEADLLNLTLHGSGYRTAAELDALVAAAGLTLAAAEPVGWGDTLRTLVP